MEQQENAKSGKHRRSTVGNRLGSGSSGNKNQQPNQQQTQIEQIVPQLEQATQMLKNVILNQQQGEGVGANAGNYGQNRPKHFGDKEIRFEPPWDCKLGQMQQVVRALQRHTNNLLDNRGSVIIRCYPYKSATYMHLVYNLIYETLSINQQFGPGLQSTPTEIRPILLHYDDNGMPNPIQQPAAPYSSMPQFNQQPNWTDIVLVRVRFDQQNPSIAFLQNFNRNVGRAFDRRQVRCPFAHPDLTQPERILRHRLQQLCVEKNGGFNRRPIPRNRFSNYMSNNNNTNGEPRYFHNGLQVYKEHPNGWTEPVQFENYTELQCLHVIVASMRKYSTMYRQKETSVIIQNVELEELSEADMERITALVYTVVNTDTYRQRCHAIQERFKSYIGGGQNAQHNTSTTGSAGNQRRTGSTNSAGNNEFLPVKIERLPRRKRGGGAEAGTATEGKTTSLAQGLLKKTGNEKKQSGSGQGSDGGEAEEKKKEIGGGSDHQKKGEEERKGEEENVEPKKEGEEKKGERPPLVRIQFRNKESATAFCQLFKICQQQQKKMEEEKNAAYEGERGHSTADSYSDLSDLEEEVFSESEGEEETEDEGENEGDKGRNDDEEKKVKKKKKQQQRNRRRHQPKMCLYFPHAFAHRDLTPPELALGYALRQYCREKNGEIESSGAGPSSSSNVASGSAANYGQQHRFYTRIGRIYERNAGAAGGNETATAKEKEG